MPYQLFKQGIILIYIRLLFVIREMAELNNYAAIPVSSNAGVTVATANGTKTMLQIGTVAGASATATDITVVSWWISFDQAVTATGVRVDLIETDTAAAVTALTPVKWSNSNSPASLCASGTGYNAVAEGAIGSSRILDSQIIPPTGGINIQYPLGRGPYVPVTRFLKLRTNTTTTSYNAMCGIVWTE